VPRSQVSAPKVRVAALGATPRSAINRVVMELRNRGWQDDGEAALSVIRALEARNGAATPRVLARAVPAEFLSRNDLTRGEFEAFFRDVARIYG
jgi:SOS response regulatory protein OraA/RecX